MNLRIYVLALLLAPNARAGSVTKPYSFSPGTVAYSSQVNSDFDTLYTEMNAKETRITTLEANGAWSTNAGGISYAGNVGIGAVPATKLHVVGTIYSDNIGLNSLMMNSAGANFGFISNPSNGVWSLGYGNTPATIATSVLSWTSGGKVGIGITNPTHLLEVGASGDGSTAIANSWLTFSDRRLKNVEGRVQNACSLLDGVNGYYYTWKSGRDSSRQIGFVAQEVEKSLPELVRTDSNGVKAVDYPKMTAVLVEAVKELRNENDALKARLEKIERLLEKR